MITYSEVEIKNLIVHFVGNKIEEGELILSEQPLNVDEFELQETLKRYFFSSFKEPDFFNYSTDAYNEMLEISKGLFETQETFAEVSHKIAERLYNVSEHPNIKSGDLMVVFFEDVLIEDEMVQAIGIFKSETKESFLELDISNEGYTLGSNNGINTNKLEKGCLIFNTEQDQGYKICIIDKSNKTEAKFWKENFLNIVPRNDSYHQTKDYIKLTKDFVSDQLVVMDDLDKTGVAEIMNRSSEFFTKVETFNEEDYVQQVFKNDNAIEAFQEYKDEHNQTSTNKLEEDFDINQDAVKKNKRFFKSILKLDSNFHVYIHGAKDKIEKGQNDNGEKFYKLFYDIEK